MLECFDLITVQVKLLEVYQAIKCAFRNLRNLIASEIEFNQILAFIETFDRHNLVETQINRFDKHTGLIQPLDLFDFLSPKVDISCLANTYHRLSHLNAVRAWVMFLCVRHMLVAETPMDQFHLDPLLYRLHGGNDHINFGNFSDFFG